MTDSNTDKTTQVCRSQIARALSLCLCTSDRILAQADFPRPLAISTLIGRKVWSREEVDEFFRNRGVRPDWSKTAGRQGRKNAQAAN